MPNTRIPVPNIIFIHIPKTGGSTLRSVFKKNTRPEHAIFLDGIKPKKSITELLSAPSHILSKTNLIYGHLDFGLHEQINKKPVYLTMLRHPVERVVSHYYYAKNHEVHILHGAIHKKKLSLLDFVSSGISTEMDNLQTRMLTGTSFYGNNEIPYGGCTQKMAEKAFSNLETNFLAYGIMEKFNWSVLYFGKILNWNKSTFIRHNKGNTERQRIKLSQAEYSKIASINKYDMYLYEKAKKRFVEKVKSELPYIEIKSRCLSAKNILLENAYQIKKNIFPPGKK